MSRLLDLDYQESSSGSFDIQGIQVQFLLLNGIIFRKNEGASTAKFTWTESPCLVDDTSEAEVAVNLLCLNGINN